jgi:hypothetical protein
MRVPGFLLHLSAMVTCAHGGRATPMTTVPKVLVGGQPIAVRTSPHGIIGCALPPPPGANGPCVTAAWVTSAVSVLSFGQPVLLQDSQAICAPSGTPVIIMATQTKVLGR